MIVKEVGKLMDSKSVDDEEEKTEEACLKCLQNQSTCGSECNKKSCSKDTDGPCCMNKEKNCEVKKNTCCKMELKSVNGNHKCCTRAGPCQAWRDSNQGCCDIEVHGREGSPCCNRSSQCKSCDLMETKNRGRSRSPDENGRGFGGKPMMGDKRVISSVVRVDRGEGEGSRTFYDTLHSPAEEPDKGSHCSTEENLRTFNTTDTNTTIMIKPQDDALVTTQNQMNQLNSTQFDENTPADFHPGHTYLPEFILVPIADTIADNDINDTEPVNETTITDLEKCGKEPNQNDNVKTEKAKYRNGLEYLNLSGCFHITGEGLG